MKVEHAIINFLNAWIVIILPLSVVLIRLAFFKFAGELEEMYRNLLAIPQDLIFIAVSFILAGLSRTIPAFAQHYSSDTEADLMGVLHIAALLIIGWLLVLANKLVMILIQNFRVAWDQINRWRVEQPDFEWKSVTPQVGTKLLLALLYISLISIIMGVQLLFACMAVGESLQHIQP